MIVISIVDVFGAISIYNINYKIGSSWLLESTNGLNHGLIGLSANNIFWRNEQMMGLCPIKNPPETFGKI